MSAGDRDNFSGDKVLTAPTGGVTRGSIYAIQDIYVVARETASAGDDFLAAVSGPVVATKETDAGDNFAFGEKVYVTANVASPNSTGATALIGYALEAAAVSDTEVLIHLTGLPVTAS